MVKNENTLIQEDLLAAVKANDVAALKQLLSSTSNSASPPDISILEAASRSGHIEATDLLIPYFTSGADSIASSRVFHDLGSWTIQDRQQGLLQHLVERYGMKIHSDDDRASYAVSNADKTIIRYLTSRGFNVNEYYTSHRGGCLDQAIRRGNVDFTQFLLKEMQADPNIGEEFVGHNTPLRTAAQYDENPPYEILNALLDAGATTDNCDALHDAVQKGSKEVVEILLEKGADVNQVVEEASNETPLMASVRSCKDLRWQKAGPIMELLLKRGADVNIIKEDGYMEGKTALEVAKELSYNEAVALLSGHGQR